MKHIKAGVLNIAYEEAGNTDGQPIILLHGFPYDPHAYSEVISHLLSVDCYIITPYLSGYGPTSFLSKDTMRSGQQAALAQDLLDLMDALGIPNAVLAGYDWGGRAACILAALWPERVKGLVSAGGYSIQDITGSGKPADPEEEFRCWYQFYFHTRRGQLGLEKNRFEFCKLLWKLWSPNWKFTNNEYEQTAKSFQNPDFVDVVIHSYRHRFGLEQGDLIYEDLENRLKAQPNICVPTIVFDCEGDGVMPPSSLEFHHQFFKKLQNHIILPSIGHNLPQEAPREFAKAVLSLL